MSGLIGGVMNEKQGRSFVGGWAGGFLSGLIQSGLTFGLGSYYGMIIGGGIGSTIGSFTTQKIDNRLGYTDYSSKEIMVNALKSGAISLVISSLSAYMDYSLTQNIGTKIGGDIYNYIDGEPLTESFASVLRAFFNTIDDIVAYEISW